MLLRLVSALVVAIAVTLGVILVAVILLTVGLDITQAIGGFLKRFAGVIGILAGVWYFIKGGNLFRR